MSRGSVTAIQALVVIIPLAEPRELQLRNLHVLELMPFACLQGLVNEAQIPFVQKYSYSLKLLLVQYVICGH